MKIAFVGKGGSGKSTVSTFFFLYLIKQHKQVVFFDADINVHIPRLLNIPNISDKAISLPGNANDVKNYLRGTSTRIESASHMYKTTPPSEGTNPLTFEDGNYLIGKYFAPYKTGYVATVGTYEKNEIGRSCYHTNLSVFENLLSFAKLNDDQWLMADMVAGIDAFSNTLHMQFDMLILIVEPTKESLDVFDQYLVLAEHAGVAGRLFIVGNKVEDDEDIAYIKKHVGKRLLGTLPISKQLKKARQNSEPLTTDSLEMFDTNLFEAIANKAKDNRIDRAAWLQQLYELHRKYTSQDYVRNEVGDITDQIDPNFVA